MIQLTGFKHFIGKNYSYIMLKKEIFRDMGNKVIL